MLNFADTAIPGLMSKSDDSYFTEIEILLNSINITSQSYMF